MKKCLAILFFLLVQTIGLWAQQKETVVTGWVCDSSMIPLEGATITELNTHHSVLTNAKGFFRFNTTTASIRIRIQYQSFETFEKEFSRVAIKDDTLRLQVILKPTVSILETVDIDAQGFELVHKKPSILVLDYDFYNNDILLLVKEGKRYQLIEVNEQDSILRRFDLQLKPIDLFKDCMGNFHVRTNDSVYQLFEIDRQWILDRGFSAQDFDRMVTPCKASSDKYLYFGKFGIHNQSVLYYQLEKTSGAGRNIRLVNDIANTKGVGDYALRAYTEWASYELPYGEISWENLVAQRHSQQDVWFYEKILSREVYHPLFKKNDSVFIFDHFVDSVIIYNLDGLFLRRQMIGYEKVPGWDREILADATNGKFYARCSRDGMAYLLELSPVDFSVVREHKLSKHVFPEKIKVHNGYAYYLYNTKNEFAVMNLYRQRLR